MNRVKIDIVERLRDAEHLNQRPGTADSDVNVFALPVQITYGDLTLAIREIERLRHELNAVQNARWVQWNVVNDFTDWSPSADTGSTTIEPWGSPYAMNPENWT